MNQRDCGRYDNSTLGGTAPSGYTLYLNVIFTILFLGELYVTVNPAGTDESESNSHE